MTKPRRVLVERVFSQHDHFDVEELLASMTNDDESTRVSRASVYRILKQLVESGLLREMDLGGRTVYEHDYGYPQHDHLHCQQCNQLVEFHSEELERIRDAVGREHGFRVSGHRFIISGICVACIRKRRRQKSRLDLI